MELGIVVEKDVIREWDVHEVLSQSSRQKKEMEAESIPRPLYHTSFRWCWTATLRVNANFASGYSRNFADKVCNHIDFKSRYRHCIVVEVNFHLFTFLHHRKIFQYLRMI
jgi:hypothetical protein